MTKKKTTKKKAKPAVKKTKEINIDALTLTQRILLKEKLNNLGLSLKEILELIEECEEE
jgi:hypothetical protein